MPKYYKGISIEHAIEETKKYLEKYSMSQREFSKKLHINESALSSLLVHGRSSNTCKKAVEHFFVDRMEEKTKMENAIKFGIKANEDEMIDMLAICDLISANLDNGGACCRIENQNWYYNDDDALKIYFKKYGIRIDLDNYCKTGLFTDGGESVTIRMEWIDSARAKQAINDINFLKRKVGQDNRK